MCRNNQKKDREVNGNFKTNATTFTGTVATGTVIKSIKLTCFIIMPFSGIKYKNSRLTDSEKKKYIEDLDYLLSSKKPYLNSSLTLNDLAKLINIPSRTLSQIINESKKMNFYDYINSYRINEAKDILSSSPGKTILEILYEVGFNSKSAFNTAFKKYTGLTPSKFKLTA